MRVGGGVVVTRRATITEVRGSIPVWGENFMDRFSDSLLTPFARMVSRNDASPSEGTKKKVAPCMGSAIPCAR